MSEPAGEVILYRSDDGQSLVQLRAIDGTAWLTRGQLAELYDTSPQNIGQIISRVLADGEVSEATRNSEFLVQREGSRDVRRRVDAYNLDMVLAVGYRVTTPRAVQFRQWATTVLKEYLVKGFALQDERLKDPAATDYFDELLARIREIRASEKRFYQKVREIFKVTSAAHSDGRVGRPDRPLPQLQRTLGPVRAGPGLSFRGRAGRRRPLRRVRRGSPRTGGGAGRCR